MSVAELRQLAFLAGQLGYPDPISVDTFRRPDFAAMSGLLRFFRILAGESNVTIEKETSNARVLFVTTSCSRLQAALRIRLHPERLYAADQTAVRELLKVALCFAEGFGQSFVKASDGFCGVSTFLSVGCGQLRQACSSLITASGDLISAMLAAPYISADVQIAMQRSSQIELLLLEKTVLRQIQRLDENSSILQARIQTALHEKVLLHEALHSRIQEANRIQERLKLLRGQRGPHYKEFVDAQRQLQQIYQKYCRLKCSLAFLDQQLSYKKAAQDGASLVVQKNLEELRKNVAKEETAQLLQGGRKVQIERSSDAYEEEEQEKSYEEIIPAPKEEKLAQPARQPEAAKSESYSYVYEEEEDVEQEQLVPVQEQQKSESYSYVYEDESEAEIAPGIKPAKPQSIITPAFFKGNRSGLREPDLLAQVKDLPMMPQLPREESSENLTAVSQGLSEYSYEYEDGTTPVQKRCTNFNLQALPLEGDPSFDT